MKLKGPDGDPTRCSKCRRQAPKSEPFDGDYCPECSTDLAIEEAMMDNLCRADGRLARVALHGGYRQIQNGPVVSRPAPPANNAKGVANG